MISSRDSSALRCASQPSPAQPKVRQLGWSASPPTLGLSWQRQRIEGCVARSARSPTRVKDFVPLFVNRFARERLQALAQVQGSIAKDVPEVLFVCVHNAGRSQMAAALLDRYANGRVHVRSAGSTPANEINRAVVDAMAERNIDLSQEFPKPLTDEFVNAADVVITMGCGDACPIYPGKRYEDWEVDDPAGQSPAAIRRIRDDIDARVRRLVESLVPADARA
jgi:arsenate reductase